MSRIGVALITGAGSGIGRATATLFAIRGCKAIAIADINDDELKRTTDLIKEASDETKVLSLKVDISNEEAVRDMVAQTAQSFGRIDHACNVAGIYKYASTLDTPTAEFDRVQSINARGVWICQKAQIIQMLKQEPIIGEPSFIQSRGTIVNVASMAGLHGYADMAAYCASKHAVIGFTRSDGMTYGKDIIRINAVCPGTIATPTIGAVDGSNKLLDTMEPAMQSMVAMRRAAIPSEAAEPIFWLSSDRTSYVNATTLTVNGGMLES